MARSPICQPQGCVSKQHTQYGSFRVPKAGRNHTSTSVRNYNSTDPVTMSMSQKGERDTQEASHLHGNRSRTRISNLALLLPKQPFSHQEALQPQRTESVVPPPSYRYDGDYRGEGSGEVKGVKPNEVESS